MIVLLSIYPLHKLFTPPKSLLKSMCNVQIYLPSITKIFHVTNIIKQPYYLSNLFLVTYGYQVAKMNTLLFHCHFCVFTVHKHKILPKSANIVPPKSTCLKEQYLATAGIFERRLSKQVIVFYFRYSSLSMTNLRNPKHWSS